MIVFQATADPHSLDVVRNGRIVAGIQWHPDRAPRLVPFNHETFSLPELEDIVDMLRSQVRR